MLFRILLFTIVLNPIVSSSEESTSGTICGTVSDPMGNPFKQATVMIDGTSVGAMTGVYGQFMITGVDPGLYTLEASHVGMRQSYMEVEVISGSISVVEFILGLEFFEKIPVIIRI